MYSIRPSWFSAPLLAVFTALLIASSAHATTPNHRETPRTTLLTQPLARGSYPEAFTVVGTTSFFIAGDGDTQSLWKTDGTPLGTVLVKPFGLAAPRGLMAFHDTLYFFAYTDQGDALWTSDGTTAGTVVAVPLCATGPAAATCAASALGVMNNTLLFFYSDDQTTMYTLWRSDGTAVGTTPLKAITYAVCAAYSNSSVACPLPNHLVVLHNVAYFEIVGSTYYHNDVPSYTLWRTDGTPSGTTIVFQARTVSSILTMVGEQLFFAATTPDTSSNTSVDLWASDGTPSGTHRLNQPVESCFYSFFACGLQPRDLTVWHSKLFFTGGVGTDQRELWVSDGTASGTRVFKNFGPSVTGPYDLTVVHDRLLFFTHRDQENLWVSDGTLDGTTSVTALQLGECQVAPCTFAVGDSLFFTGYDAAHGSELWRSDGTATGTRLVKDINPAVCQDDRRACSSFPTMLGHLGNTVFVRADDHVRGERLWASDGTSAGTRLVTDRDGIMGPNTFVFMPLTSRSPSIMRQTRHTLSRKAATG